MTLDTALRDLRRGGSSNDAEITERVRACPRFVEWESRGSSGGDGASSPEGNSPIPVRCDDHTVSLFVAAH